MDKPQDATAAQLAEMKAQKQSPFPAEPLPLKNRNSKKDDKREKAKGRVR